MNDINDWVENYLEQEKERRELEQEEREKTAEMTDQEFYDYTIKKKNNEANS